jgi:hypothetical protein
VWTQAGTPPPSNAGAAAAAATPVLAAASQSHSRASRSSVEVEARIETWETRFFVCGPLSSLCVKGFVPCSTSPHPPSV